MRVRDLRESATAYKAISKRGWLSLQGAAGPVGRNPDLSPYGGDGGSWANEREYHPPFFHPGVPRATFIPPHSLLHQNMWIVYFSASIMCRQLQSLTMLKNTRQIGVH